MAVSIAREGFDLDLRHGQAREDALVHVMLASQVEVKSDGLARRTGNLFIEYRCRGRASGLAVTTADRWAFEYDDGAWLIVPTDRVRDLARRALAEDRRAIGGDDHASEGALVPLRWFVGRHHTLPVEDLEARAA